MSTGLWTTEILLDLTTYLGLPKSWSTIPGPYGCQWCWSWSRIDTENRKWSGRSSCLWQSNPRQSWNKLLRNGKGMSSHHIGSREMETLSRNQALYCHHRSLCLEMGSFFDKDYKSSDQMGTKVVKVWLYCGIQERKTKLCSRCSFQDVHYTAAASTQIKPRKLSLYCWREYLKNSIKILKWRKSWFS